MVDNKEENIEDIEVIIGDSSDIQFSKAEDLIEELKPNLKKKSNIIIPGAKKKKDKEKK